jgi:hypothetical protein
MRQWKQVLGVAGLVVLVGFFVRDQQNGQPRAGETVTPHLEWPIQWTAGTMGELGVRLYAQQADAKGPRLLDFSAIPWRTSPLANIAFYCGDQQLSSLEVALSHRC